MLDWFCEVFGLSNISGGYRDLPQGFYQAFTFNYLDFYILESNIYQKPIGNKLM